jgi:predicted transcriptional regulator of viral defense system
MAAWLPLRDAGAVVSHESALELHGLSDVIPDAVHLSLPRSERGQRRRGGVRLHTLNRPPTTKTGVRNVEGLPVTNPERTIVDALEAGAQPEQVEMAIREALERGLTTPRRLTEAASERSARVRKFIERRLEGTPA